MVAAVLRCSASAGMLVVRVFHGLGAGGQGCFQSGEQREEVVLQSTRVHQVLISSSNPPNQFSLFRHVKYSTGVGQRRPNDYQEAYSEVSRKYLYLTLDGILMPSHWMHMWSVSVAATSVVVGGIGLGRKSP